PPPPVQGSLRDSRRGPLPDPERRGPPLLPGARVHPARPDEASLCVPPGTGARAVPQPDGPARKSGEPLGPPRRGVREQPPGNDRMVQRPVQSLPADAERPADRALETGGLAPGTRERKG